MSPTQTSDFSNPLTWLLLALPAAFILGFVVLGSRSLVVKSLSERSVARQTQVAFLVVLLGSVALFFQVLVAGGRVTADLSSVYQPGYGLLAPSLVADLPRMILLVPFVMILGLVGRFSATYLHRESGYDRFFLLLWLFAAGTAIVLLSARADLFFIGWEFVGLTSALLIGFFRNREQPIRAGLRAWVTYRICDMSLLLAFILLHHAAGSFAWDDIFRAAPKLSTAEGLVIGFLLVFGAMGKSAQAPIGGWLHRAMEGPTPSSALFYGGISVHLGAWLLLLMRPVLAQQPAVLVAVGVIGAVTAFTSNMSSRVRPDVKSAIGWGVSSQLGIIWIEIAVGATEVATIHVVAHAIYRTAELLNSPEALHERQARDAAVGTRLRLGHPLPFRLPARIEERLYTLAFYGFKFDAVLERAIIAPFDRLSRWLDRADRRLSGDEIPAPTREVVAEVNEEAHDHGSVA